MLVSIEARKRRPLGGLDPAGGSTAAPLESVLDPTNMGSFGEKITSLQICPVHP